MTMKLKKPDKDRRGEWDLVLDNEGTTVGIVKCYGLRVRVALPIPTDTRQQPWDEWREYAVLPESAVTFFTRLGVDTAPLEKLIEEKEA